MNKYLKEAIWFFVPIILAFLFTIYAFGISVFSEETTSINIRDTYYVFSPFHFLIALAILFIIIAYLVRILHHYLKSNKIANYLFLVLQAIFIVLFSFVMIFNWSNKSSVDFLPNEKGEYVLQIADTYPIGKPYWLAIIQFILVLLLLYSSVKVDRKFKRIHNEK